MKITKEMESAINAQINAEFFSGYLYLSMAAFFERQNLPGFSTWMRMQAQEEQIHGMKLFNYLLERGGSFSPKAIDAPASSWGSPLAVFQESFKHEQDVTGMINKLYEAARAENDHATEIQLQWFITEQVEEESSAEAIVEKLKLAGDKPQALLMLDRELGSRAPPSSGAEGGE
ncbi:MAG: ferritin [Candidatus Micrarchaeota archaeon]